MAKRDEIDELDTLIEEAVDTYFVEAPSNEGGPSGFAQTRDDSSDRSAIDSAAPKAAASVSLDEAVDSLFMTSFEPTPVKHLSQPTTVTSGDPEIDQAIDLAVDTLFVEEPETPPPETAQLRMSDSPNEDQLDYYPGPEQSYSDRVDFAGKALSEMPREKMRSTRQADLTYDDVMAMEIGRHMHTMYDETAKAEEAAEAAEAKPEKRPVPAPAKELSKDDALALRKLQEAILTLEWEVSRRSVTVLANELHRVRTRFQENVTVDFAAMSMRVVLDYVVKRMARAHPESIRFLLEVTEFLERILVSPGEDPLRAFHQILTRYERYKSAVRKAEGLLDRRPAILSELEIKDPESFANLVDAHASTLIKASHSLANGLKRVRDPENLIRSFRFLVTRSFDRILEKTHRQKVEKKAKSSVPSA
ncbi:MAG: hypothetical protein HY913_12025 [Desulfomonile tiedjei]|nr:hypothetical protein [Desulfomonile tiedjei]